MIRTVEGIFDYHQVKAQIYACPSIQRDITEMLNEWI